MNKLRLAVAMSVLATPCFVNSQVPTPRPRVLVVGFGAAPIATHQAAANEVRSGLSLLDSARTMRVFPKQDVDAVARTSGVEVVGSVEDLRQFGKIVGADVAIGVTAVTTPDGVRLQITLVYAQEAKAPVRQDASGRDVASAARDVVSKLALDPTLRTHLGLDSSR